MELVRSYDRTVLTYRVSVVRPRRRVGSLNKR